MATDDHDGRTAAAVQLAVETLALRDPVGRAHASGVEAIAVVLAEQMELSDETIERVRVAAALHDLGKLGVPLAILQKRGRLTRGEFDKVQEHPAIGGDILSRTDDFAHLAHVVRSHHERWSGGGYPDGLAGEDIPLESRIINVADAIEAMTHDRPYRRRLDLDVALEEVHRLRGDQFCPSVVDRVADARDALEALVEESHGDVELEPDHGPSPTVLDHSHEHLDDVSPGGSAVVAHVGGSGELRRRLLELGVVPGVPIEVVRVAPMGDPLEVRVRRASFFLPKEEARRIGVRVAEAAPEAAPLREPIAGKAPLSRRFHVAIAGNPNTGKTSLFNALTDSRARVGNYPGITVDRLTSDLDLGEGLDVSLVDVPGTYSLNARSRDEQVAIDEVLGRAGAPEPDVVIVVLNATALDRSLYLLLQIQELGQPIIAVVNMMDEARAKGVDLDLDGLASELGVAVIGASARTGEGVDELRGALQAMLLGRASPQTGRWRWTPDEGLLEGLDDVITTMGDMLGPEAVLSRRRAFALWGLMSLSEEDDLAGIPAEVRSAAVRVAAALAEEERDLDLEVSKARYDEIDAIVSAHERRGSRRGPDLTERLDGVLTHPFWGLLVFLVTMGVIFTALFDWASPLMDGIEWVIGEASRGARAVLPDGLVEGVLVDGVLAGVGSVLVFLPQILILFFFITVLETSGYLSRAAFMVDRLMQKLGLNGKAFVPMLSGYACAVPAIMSARTLENPRDRLLTIMVIPLTSCSARLPVYTLLIAALFPAEERVLGPISLGVAMMFGLYLLATALALVAAGVLGRTVLKGSSEALVLELPPYRAPSLKEVARVLWQRAKDFLRTAGTVILVASVVLWGLLTFPRLEPPTEEERAAEAAAEGDEDRLAELQSLRRAAELEHSFAGRFGRLIEPLIEPLGFDWKIGIGLLGSFAAREVFISTLGQVYAVGEADEASVTLRQSLRSQRRADGSLVYTPLTGVALLIYFMIALQCLSTVAVVRQETGSWRWVGFQLLYITGLAYVAALLVYQGGRLLGFE